jgi:hypothetical protein
MFDVIAAVNDDEVLERNLMRSPLLARPGVSLLLRRDFPSAALAYRSAMADSASNLLVFAHQDAYLPATWEDRLRASIARVERVDPYWAVLGIYGTQRTGAQVGCVWSSGLGAVYGAPFEEPAAVESMDEVVLVLRRDSGVEFDADLPGFHLYATDLVQSAIAKGCGAWVIYAPVVHNSRPCVYLDRHYFRAYDYVAAKWRERLPIPNHVAPVERTSWRTLRLRARHRLLGWSQWPRDSTGPPNDSDCVGIARRLGFE